MLGHEIEKAASDNELITFCEEYSAQGRTSSLHWDREPPKPLLSCHDGYLLLELEARLSFHLTPQPEPQVSRPR